MPLINKTKQLSWKSYIGIGIFIFIYWYFLPLQSEYYLERDLISFNQKDTLIILGIVFLILFTLIYRFLHDEKDAFIRAAQTFAYAIFFSGLYFFVIHHKLIDVALLTNRIVSTEQVLEDFEVTYIHKNNIGISALDNTYNGTLEDKFKNEDIEQLSEGDIITIVFDNGIFGKKYISGRKVNIQEKNHAH
jgi:hypothetical protein